MRHDRSSHPYHPKSVLPPPSTVPHLTLDPTWSFLHYGSPIPLSVSPVSWPRIGRGRVSPRRAGTSPRFVRVVSLTPPRRLGLARGASTAVEVDVSVFVPHVQSLTPTSFRQKTPETRGGYWGKAERDVRGRIWDHTWADVLPFDGWARYLKLP